MFVLWFVITLLLAESLAHPRFQELIPNGNNVPHPCKANYRWPGVGHNNPQGGGERNPFGVDFQKANFKWSSELCNKDSDGDGRRNGEELGDPGCVWSPGQLPSRTVSITHPGVCDPFNSSQCQGKNTFVSCKLDAFEGCDAIKKPGVTKIELRFNRTEVPASETNYMCQTFDLPNNTDMHIIANEPVIDNANVLHHMIVYACHDGDDYVIETPTLCSMSASRCAIMISGWTVGMSGMCFGSKSGYRIGPTGYKRVRLEIHYNNPEKISTYTDASGMRLYIQPAVPEVQDMATFVTGQTQIWIPPGQSRVEHVGMCPGSCSRMLLNKPVYVILANNHMHYRGSSMKVELIREGVKIADITNDAFYSYDSPVTHMHDPPIEIRPGDDIKTTCVYNSLSTDHYVMYGESTSDEMCFGFLSTYPKDAFTYGYECDASGPLSVCDRQLGQPVAGCDWVAFTDLSNPNTSIMAEILEKKCSLNGFCRPECRDYLMSIKDHPCLSGEASTYVKQRMTYSRAGLAILGRLNSCNLDQCQNVKDGASKTSSVFDIPIFTMFIYGLYNQLLAH